MDARDICETGAVCLTPPDDLPDGHRLAWDAILGRATSRIPIRGMNIMEWSVIDRLAGVAPGTYRKKPLETYLAMQRNLGVCALDQFIPENPLTLGAKGYEGKALGATTGAAHVVCDGMEIREPEDVVAHLESVEWPRLRARIDGFDEAAHIAAVLAKEEQVQTLFGKDILKTGYGFIGFPRLRYGAYGYVNYFSAYALYPDMMERDFTLQADWWRRVNRAAAKAYVRGALPPVYRLDHDMADSRGMLVDIRGLDRIWLPHFARCIEPAVRAGVKLVWHSDGNLMALYPRLLEAGIAGFQGFQYEDGMDYPTICALRTRDGEEPIIEAGVSVTRTLPLGTPGAVRDELRFLVEHGPRGRLFLGLSSSMAPGVPWRNIAVLAEGLRYYRDHGRE